MTQPVPLEVPRVGRTVPVVARVYGDGAHGIPGIKVQATITSGGTNTIAPEYAVSDYSGYVRYYYTCNDAGVAIDDIDLTATFDTADEFVRDGGSTLQTILPPSAVDNEKYFAPGFWGYTAYSSASSAAKWDTYFSEYGTGGEEAEEEESPLVGVMHDYAWTDIEPDLGDWSYTKMQNDLDYLESKGMKLLIRFDLQSPDDLTYWVPDDIVHQIPPLDLYAVSAQVATGGKGGIMHLTHTKGSGYYPMLWDDALRQRFNTMITQVIAQFGQHEAFAGIAPVGHDGINSTDIRDTYTGGTRDLLTEVKRSTLVYTNGLTQAPVWDFTYSNSLGSYRYWNRDNGIFYGPERWNVERLSESEYLSQFIGSIYKTVGTGAIVKTSDFAQLNCAATAVTAKDVTVGGVNMRTDTCDKAYVNEYNYWFAFVELSSSVWNDAEEGLKVTAENFQLRLAQRYNEG